MSDYWSGCCCPASSSQRNGQLNEDRAAATSSATATSAPANTSLPIKNRSNLAREIIPNLGGGTLPIKNELGLFINSDTITGPKHQESLALDRK